MATELWPIQLLVFVTLLRKHGTRQFMTLPISKLFVDSKQYFHFLLGYLFRKIDVP